MSSSAPNGAIIIQPGEDGYSDGYNVIQGVRAFDPSLGSFTTPDAYAGDLRDPMSRKPFVWDRNNPVAYSDPSGYQPDDGGAESRERVGIDAYRAADAEAFADQLNLQNCASSSKAALGRAAAGGVVIGVYKFITSRGESYVGQSINVAKRFAQHLLSGKVTPEGLKDAVVRAITGGKPALKQAEQGAINAAREDEAAGGLRNANNRNPHPASKGNRGVPIESLP